MKGTYLEPVVWWALLAVPITLLSLLIYVGGQQVLRQSVNDLPAQLAQDVASGTSGVPTNHVDIAQSLSPFVIVYDKNGTPISGNGYLDGKLPTPPKGVFENVDFWANGHSWQPQSDPVVRVDVAIVPTDTGFILAGQNMRQVEQHIIHLGGLLLTGWIFTLGATFVMCFIAWSILGGHKKSL